MQKINGTLGKKIANILIHDIAPVYEDRQGGYTRIIKLNNRKNDNAPVSILEFVDITPEINEVEKSVEVAIEETTEVAVAE